MRTPVLLPPRLESAADMHPLGAILGAVILYGVLGLLLFGPLAFGAVEPWSIFVLEAGASALFAVWVLRQVVAGELRITANPLFLPMLVFAGLIAIQLAIGHTEYSYETRSDGLLYCAYGLLCFLLIQGFRRTFQVRTLAWVVSAYGFAVAMFALCQSLTSDGKLYWFRVPRSGGWIYGPYVNHNHYAGLMEMLVPIPLVISLFQSVPGPRRALAGSAAALMAGTVFLSGSRGGMLALIAELALLIVLAVRRHKGRATALALSLFLVLAVAMLVWLGGSNLTDRLASFHSEARMELSGGTRLDIARDSLRMFLRKPVLGWGLGVFPTVYPEYRSFYTDMFVNQAHNDYLQLLVEMGSLGFAVMLWFLVTTYVRAVKKLGNWADDINGALALACLLGITGIAVHSFVDFNLHIPANAALFYVLCVVAAMDPRFAGSGQRCVRRLHGELAEGLSA